ncbi:MAG: NPCBM/NEW2 domain-containing protein [Cyanobacteriota bacterium]|nr:NPCBM/NEW2 domain-containing protein [Cyanobacteriota bacterium]
MPYLIPNLCVITMSSRSSDTTPPVAWLVAEDLTDITLDTYTFNIIYSDTSGINIHTIDSNDIRVNGPGDYRRMATLVSTSQNAETNSYTATYSIPSPRGLWISADNGSYQVLLLRGAITDQACPANSTPTSTLGSFRVRVSTPNPEFVYLSSLTPRNVQNGWGPYERDQSNGEWMAGDGRTLSISGSTYSKGLGVHAPSSLTYDLNGDYSTFQAFIGLDDEIDVAGAARGSVVFSVIANGSITLYQSPVLTSASAPVPITVNVSGVQTLELRVEGTADGIFYDHANWADAKLLGINPPDPGSDHSPPTAVLTADNLSTAPISTYTFTVTYEDPSGVNINTIDSQDIVVYGPNQLYSQRASLVAVNQGVNANTVMASYSIPSPGETWDSADNGSYLVILRPNEVEDNSTPPNSSTTTSLGLFSVEISTPVSRDGTVYLSDLTPTSDWNGWGPYERDRSNGELGASDGRTMSINGTTFRKGLGVHADSSLTYNLSGAYSRFQAVIGIDDEVDSNGISRGSVVFSIIANGGSVLYRSPVLRGSSAPVLVDVDVSDVQTLELRVEATADGKSFDHANWGDAKLFRREIVNFDSNDVNFISEADGMIALTAVRSISSLNPTTVEITTNEVVGSATADVDFLRPSAPQLPTNTGLISFQSGQSSQSFNITIINDLLQEDIEQFTAGLQNPNPGTLGAPRTARVVIIDDDGPARISFSESSINVIENEGQATLTLLRSGDLSSAASVEVSLIDGSANRQTDYRQLPMTLQFEPGVFQQDIAIPIINDLVAEDSETFQVMISQPQGAVLQGNATATLIILDNDGSGGDPLKREVFLHGVNSAGTQQLDRPTSFDWLPDGRMLIAEKSGIVKMVADGALQSTPVIDLQSIVNDSGDRGLLALAVHPDFNAESPYLYLAYSYDPPETRKRIGLAGPDGAGNRASRVERITVDPVSLEILERDVILGQRSRWKFISSPDVDGTGKIDVLPSGIVNGTTITDCGVAIDSGYQDNIPSMAGNQNQNIRDFLACDSTSHSIGDLEFGPDGYLYVTNGDGASYNFADPRAIRAQDLANLSGKMLRLDPLTGAGVASNPFYNGSARSNPSKVFYYGLRNAFRFTFDPVTQQPVLGDVGWSTWEEINTAPPGANFGWPYFEGPDRPSGYNDLNSAQDFYGNSNRNPGSPDSQSAVFPISNFSHASPDNFAALMVGDFIDDDSFLYGDINSGRLFKATLDQNRQISSTESFDSGLNYITELKLGPDGLIYGSLLYDSEFGPGSIIRWVPG